MHAPGCEVKELTRLMMLHKVGEPPEHPDHNIGYDHVVIESCPACDGATVESLRHDCFDWESVYDQYEWYELSPADGAKLKTSAGRCQQPLNPFCGCSVHQSLRASARALPSSSWDVVFEWGAHRHVVTLGGSDDAPTLTPAGSEMRAAPASTAASAVTPTPPSADVKTVSR